MLVTKVLQTVREFDERRGETYNTPTEQMARRAYFLHRGTRKLLKINHGKDSKPTSVAILIEHSV